MPYGSAFAAWYDLLTREIDYPARAQYFDSLIRARMPVDESTILLDLACGTGSLSAAFAALGYDVIGVDASAEMLSEAAAKNGGQRPVLYLCQQADQLDLYGTIDVCVCALDSINHIDTPKAVQKTFERVSLFTVPGGLFVFDVNTEYKHRTVLADNTFVYDFDEVYCVWQNATDQGLRTEITLDLFEREGDAYFREEERFIERAYSHSQLCGWLQQAGFELLDVYAGDTLEPVGEETQRAVYLARKR